MEVQRLSKLFKDNTVFISSLYQGGFNPNNFIYLKKILKMTLKRVIQGFALTFQLLNLSKKIIRILTRQVISLFPPYFNFVDTLCV